jgi:hypothetical protein
MGMSGSLDAVLSRRVTEGAERAARLRAERRVDETRRPPVKDDEAQPRRAEREPVKVNPVAVPEMVRPNEDPPHLVDILV